MQKKSPKDMVAERFGSRIELVKAIMKLVGGGDEVRGRLMGTTNKKLLRIHEVATLVDAEFGGKKGLLDAIEKLQFPGGKANDGWRDKYDAWTVKRLYDLHRQLAARAPTAG